MRKKPNSRALSGVGDPCPRCEQPTQIRGHRKITYREKRRRFYYSQWFKCVNAACRTDLIMPERFIVFPERKLKIHEETNIPKFTGIVLEMHDRPPWEE